MKKLTLLLLALPLAACATPQQVSQMREKQYMTAEAHCRADDSGPSDPQYGKCIKEYLLHEYGVALYRAPDGTLKVARYLQSSWPSPDAYSAFAAPYIGPGPPPTPPPGR
jgi:hypothetical protein